MPPAPRPSNDAPRLEALRACGVLDTKPDPAFDNVTQMAANLLRVPIAMVSLVDESRQWFKSRVGVDVNETPRDHAFCAYAILSDGPLVIEDATRDPRTHDNPLVTGPPGVRAYAGHPLILEDGFAIGTLCAIDTEPRVFTTADLDRLRRLAHLTARILDACRQADIAAHNRSETSTLRRALNEHTLFSITDTSGKILDVNDGFCRISGYERHELVGQDHRILNSGHHPTSFWKNMWDTVSAGHAWRAEVCNRRKDGSLYWVDSTNVPQFDAKGRVHRFVSLGFEITPQKRAEYENRRLLAAFERSPDAMVIADLDGIVRSHNSAAVSLDASIGYAIRVGSPSLVFDPARASPAVADELRRCINLGRHFEASVPVRRSLGMHRPVNLDGHDDVLWLDVSVSPLDDEDGQTESILIIKRDISAAVRSGATAQLRAEGNRACASISRVLADEAPIESRLRRCLHVTHRLRQLESTSTGCVLATLDTGGGARVLASTGALSPLTSSIVSNEMWTDRAVQAAAAGELVVVDDAEAHPTSAPSAPSAPERPHGRYLVPLRKDNICVGVLCLWTDARPSREPDRLDALQQIGDLLARAIDRDRRESELAQVRTETSALSERLSVATEGAGVGVWEFHPERNMMLWDETMFRLYSVSPQTRPSLDRWLASMHPDDRARVASEFQQAIAGDHDFATGYRVRTQADGIRHLRASATVVRNAEGEVSRVVGANWDVTAVVEREHTLAEIKTALDAANDAVFVFEADTLRFVYVNQAAIEQVGYPITELRSMTPEDLVTHGEFQSFRGRVDAIIAAPSSSITFRTHHTSKTGEEHPVEISLKLIEHLGAHGRFVAIVRDITDQLAAEHTLRKEIARAEDANRAKSEFLANMSHEIRTPMTAILGYADLLCDDAMLAPSQALDTVRTIQSNANHLLTIINDILDVSKIEAGQMTTELIETDPAKLVREVATLVEPRFRAKGLALNLELATEVPEVITSDPTRLRQILLNLLGNAIKFTERGSVTVRVTHDPTTWLMSFEIRDTGLGMSNEQLTSIRKFEAFSQADASTTRRFGGTGLGLRISNALAVMLGGRIEVESTLGKGSTFTVSIGTGDTPGIPLVCPYTTPPSNAPLPQAAPGPGTQAKAAPSLRGIHVLLAEDGTDNQRLFRFLLERAGATVTVCENGRVALDHVLHAEPHQQPDLILMDMQMPELDGYGATSSLRERGVRTPIIALTAHAMDGDRQRCLQAGCDEYLTKPIDKNLLIETCARWAATARNAA